MDFLLDISTSKLAACLDCQMYSNICRLIGAAVCVFLADFMLRYVRKSIDKDKQPNPFTAKKIIATKKGDKIYTAYFWIRSAVYLSEKARHTLSLGLFLFCMQMYWLQHNNGAETKLILILLGLITTWLCYETTKYFKTRKKTDSSIETTNGFSNRANDQQGFLYNNNGQVDMKQLRRNSKLLTSEINEIKRKSVF